MQSMQAKKNSQPWIIMAGTGSPLSTPWTPRQDRTLISQELINTSFVKKVCFQLFHENLLTG